jgi:hypothetical protein
MTIADDVALTLTLFMREATPVRSAYPGVKASELHDFMRQLLDQLLADHAVKAGSSLVISLF